MRSFTFGRKPTAVNNRAESIRVTDETIWDTVRNLIDAGKWETLATLDTSAVTNMDSVCADIHFHNHSGITLQWDTHNVRTMRALFTNSNFNGSLAHWKTSAVTNMESMFQNAHAFDQPLDQWDTSAVTNMESMFRGARAFNQPLNQWDTSAVTSMAYMFAAATSFNQPLDQWDTTRVTTMHAMFSHTTEFNQPLNTWKTAAVTDMNSMFSFTTAFNQPLNAWDTTRVITMEHMFSFATAFNQPLNAWDTAAVTTMTAMFQNASAFNHPLDRWVTARVTDMAYMFADTLMFNQPLNSWNTAAVTNMYRMFAEAIAFNQPLNSWNTTAVTNMDSMFLEAWEFNQPLDAWNVNAVTTFKYMFYNARSFNQPLFSLKIGPNLILSFMFQGCPFWQPLRWTVVDPTLRQNQSLFNRTLIAERFYHILGRHADEELKPFRTAKTLHNQLVEYKKLLQRYDRIPVSNALRELRLYEKTKHSPTDPENSSILLKHIFTGKIPVPGLHEMMLDDPDFATNIARGNATRRKLTVSEKRMKSLHSAPRKRYAALAAQAADEDDQLRILTEKDNDLLARQAAAQSVAQPATNTLKRKRSRSQTP